MLPPVAAYLMEFQRSPYHRIRLGFGHAYLVRSQRNWILVDAGSARQEKAFIRHLAQQKISAQEIKLIVITHVHFDHVGSLKAIKALCGCPVAVHEKEGQLLSKGIVAIPPGTNLFGKTASCLGKLMKPFFRFSAVEPEVIISEDFSLEPYGIPGSIIPTEGHTEGSLSVLLSSGEAFVGDLAANHLPFELGPILPPFAASVPELLRSWEKLLSFGPTIICPGHGKPFRADLLARRLRQEARAAVKS